MGSVVATVGIRRSIDSALSGKVERQSPLWITSALVSPVGRPESVALRITLPESGRSGDTRQTKRLRLM